MVFGARRFQRASGTVPRGGWARNAAGNAHFALESTADVATRWLGADAAPSRSQQSFSAVKTSITSGKAGRDEISIFDDE